jgi:hypothetical protein
MKMTDKKVIHGLDINGEWEGQPVISYLAGGSFLASYFYADRLRKKVDWIIENVGRDEVFMLDNGAFSAWKAGTDIFEDEAYVEGFEDWAGAIMHRCPQALVILPDRIGGTVEDNNELARQSIFYTDDRSVYVWHMDEPIWYLLNIAEDRHHIAFGSAGKYKAACGKVWEARVKEAFDALDKHWADPEVAAAYVKPQIHLLRGIGQMNKFPFDSADSTNLGMNHNDRRKVYNEPIPAFRDRVEAKARSGAPGFGDPRIGTPRELYHEAEAHDVRWADELENYKLTLSTVIEYTGSTVTGGAK